LLTEADEKSSSDTILYTVTADSTVRIFMPVLDSPDHLQLHASLDLHAFGISRNLGVAPRICWLDRDAVMAALNKGFEQSFEGSPQDQEEESARRSRLKSIVDEGWDLFAVATGDGTVVIRAVTVRMFHTIARLNDHTKLLTRTSIADRQPYCINSLHLTLLLPHCQIIRGSYPSITSPRPPTHSFSLPLNFSLTRFPLFRFSMPKRMQCANPPLGKQGEDV
jgi:hypothetical protein